MISFRTLFFLKRKKYSDMLNMKALVGIRIIFIGKEFEDECSGCSLLERNLYQYGVHAKIIVFCKTYITVHGVHEMHIGCTGCTGCMGCSEV